MQAMKAELQSLRQRDEELALENISLKTHSGGDALAMPTQMGMGMSSMLALPPAAPAASSGYSMPSLPRGNTFTQSKVCVLSMGLC
jgi:hypothetical protein